MNKSTIRVMLVAIGAVAILIAIAAARNGSGASTQAKSGAHPGSDIDWLTSLEPALAKAKETGQPVMIDFFATWCPPCKMLDKETYTDPAVIEETKKWIMVRIDVDQNRSLAQQYWISSIPTLVVVEPDGKESSRTTGFIPPGAMLKFMGRGSRTAAL